jgi:tetratricopeptide (TPR) repeat protein
LNTTALRPTTPRAVFCRVGPHLARLLGAALTLALLASAAAQVSAPADPAELVRYGNLYFRQGDCALAQYFFQEALKRDEGNVEALVGKGRSLSCQNAFNAAVESLRRAIEVDPRHVPAYVHLALTYQEQYMFDSATYANRLGEALDVLQRAENVGPNDATVQNTKGIVLYQAGNLDQARVTLERAHQLAVAAQLTDRERSTIQLNLGRTYRDLDELELAQQAFRRAVVLDPASAAAHNNLGNVMFRLGDCSGAEFELSQAVSLAPNSLSAVSSLAIALFECNRVSETIPLFERALQLDGAVFAPPLFTYLARAYLDAGRLDDAVRRAQQGALLPPESAEAHYYLGTVYQARRGQGDVEAARRAFERALELDPGFDPARQALTALR